MEEEKKLNAGSSQEKPTYEELKNYCNQLMMQRNQIAGRLNQVTDVINMLPWLFEVVKNKELFRPGFVDMCIKSIEAIMTPPEDNSGKETESKAESNK